jgi:DNA-binding MarR family transcriptional regulator
MPKHISSELHLGRILGNALRRFDGRVLELMAGDESLPLKWSNYLRHGVVTAAQLHMVRHLPLDGGRLVDLAQTAGMSKQSMKAMLDQCEAMGLLMREKSGAVQGDRRSKWIRYTEMGLLWRQAFYRAVEQAQHECEAELGSHVVAVIRLGLDAYAGDFDRAVRP